MFDVDGYAGFKRGIHQMLASGESPQAMPVSHLHVSVELMAGCLVSILISGGYTVPLDTCDY